MNDLGQSWFYQYQQEQNVLTIDEVNERVGINDSTPQYDLEVNNTIRTSNLLTDTASACNVSASNITTSNITSCNINYENKLLWQGYDLYEECPLDTNDWNNLIPFKEDIGLIHESWIRKPLTAVSVLQDLWNIAETGVDIAEAVLDAYNFFKGTGQEALTAAAIQALQELLQNEGTGSNTLRVSWENLKNRPIATNGSIGLLTDLYINNAKSLYALPTNKLTYDAFNNLKFSNTNNAVKVIDFATSEAFLKQLTLSNNGVNTLIVPDELITSASNFKMFDLRFGNSNIYNSSSNISINGVKLFEIPDLELSAIQADQMRSFTYKDPTGTGANLGFYGYETILTHLKTPLASNIADRLYTRIRMTDKEIIFDKLSSNNNQVVLFSVNSNGEFYTYSNLRTNAPFTARAIATSIDDFPREGLLTLDEFRLKYVRRKVDLGSNIDTFNFSTSSNGIVLGERPSIFGGTETVVVDEFLGTTTTNYARLDISLSNGGLRYGYGLCNNPLVGDFDIFNVSRKGEIYTLNQSNLLMKQILNSNANLTTNLIINANTFFTSNEGLKINNKIALNSNGFTNSNFVMNSNGGVEFSGKSIITDGGAISMKTYTDPSSNQGVLISPSGITQINGTNFVINNEGFMTTRMPITASNISTSNLTVASNMTASNFATSNASISNLRVFNTDITVNPNGVAFVASNSSQSNAQFSFINQQAIGNTSYVYINPVHNQGGGNPYANIGVYTYSNGQPQGTGRLNLQGQLLDNFTRFEDKYALSNTLSNLATSNALASLSNSLSNVNSNLSSNLNALSNWTDATFRKKSVNVPWGEISGKPNFSASNDSIDFAGVALGSAGLVMGGLALLNQNGQLTSVLSSATNLLKLNPSGYSRMDEGLKLLGDGTNGITLDPSGSISALTGAFNYSSFTQGVKIGLLSMTLSNDQIFWTSNTTSNSILSSNAHITRNNQPFTFSNANVNFTCNVGVSGTMRSSNIISNGGVAIGTSNYQGIGTAIINTNISGGYWFGTTNSNIYLTRFVNEDIDVSSNQLLGGMLMRSYNTQGSAPYGIVDRQLYGLGFVVRNGASSNIEALSIDNQGEVGIGTSNPTYRLDVAGDARCSNLTLGLSNVFAPARLNVALKGDAGIGGHFAWFGYSNESPRLALVDATSTGAKPVGIRTFGTAGFGIYPAGPIQFFNFADSETMRITNAGNVGIGITNPSTTLDVNGNIKGNNVNATNFIENSVALSTKYAPSNTLNSLSLYATSTADKADFGCNVAVWSSNTARFSSNTAVWSSNNSSNLTSLTQFTSFSNWTNNQYARSNAQSNWNFASNVAVWSSNNFANFATSTNFTATSNYAYTDRYWTWSNSSVYTTSNVRCSNLQIGSATPFTGQMGMRHINANNQTGVGLTSGGAVVIGASTFSVQNSNNQNLFEVDNTSGIYTRREMYLQSNLYVNQGKFIEFGEGVAGKQADAGRIAYRRYAQSNALDIVGAGTTIGNRLVKVYDILSIDSGVIENPTGGGGIYVSDYGKGYNYGGISHRDKTASGDYALLHSYIGETTINASYNQEINFKNDDTLFNKMDKNGVFTFHRKMLLSSNVNSDSPSFLTSHTTAGDLAIFSANSSSYLSSAGVSASSNVFQIGANGNTQVSKGDFAVINRGNRFDVSVGTKAGATGGANSNWVDFDTANGGGFWFWEKVEINGSLTATSKSFKIDHPIDATKKLIHCCVEAPRADLMYSGTVKLVKGKATVEIDIGSCPECPMTKGTFEALTRNARVFLQNNDGFTPVKGKVIGGELHIEAQNKSCDDEIHWNIIAERKDKNMMNSSATNEQGHLLTEILK